jgi:hypothetical protein
MFLLHLQLNEQFTAVLEINQIRIVHIFFLLQLVHTDTVNNKLCLATVLGQLRKRCSIHGASRLCHSWCALPNLLNWRSLFLSSCQENIGPHHSFDAFPFIFCLPALMKLIWSSLLGCPTASFILVLLFLFFGLLVQNI